MSEQTFDLTIRREMPTKSTTDPTFEAGGVLDGKKPALLIGLEYVTDD